MPSETKHLNDAASASGSSSSSDNSSRKRKRSSKPNGGGKPSKKAFADAHLHTNGGRRGSVSKAARDPRDQPSKAVAVRQPSPVVDHDGLSRAGMLPPILCFVILCVVC